MSQPDMNDRLKFLTAPEVAEILKMNPQVISRKLQQGEIPGYKIGKDWRISEKDLWEWIQLHSNRRPHGLEAKVIDNFIVEGRVKAMPAQHKKRLIILNYILGNFRQGQVYSEKEVNEIILRFHDDYCTVRREFIAEKMMFRSGGKYRRNSSYKLVVQEKKPSPRRQE